jgi:hypothetical protein
MRSAGIVLVTTLVGCLSGTGEIVSHDRPDAGTAPPTDGGGDSGSPPPTFQIVSPTVDLDPNQDITYCYYFHTPNTSDLAIRQWVSRMTPGAHDIDVYLTQSDVQTAGSLSTDKCGFIANGIGPVWVYSSDTPDGATTLPLDDGYGAHVGLPLHAGHAGFIQMHFVNTTAAVLHAHVELDGYAYDDGVQVTPAGSFYTYSTKIDLGPGSAAMPTKGTVTGSCDVAAGSKFYLVSAHTHKQGVHMFVKDDAATVFDTVSWEHPLPVTWASSPFYTFASGKLSWQCDYVNPNNYRIEFGDNAATAEICMAVGYFFPSPGGAGAFCLDSAMIN